MRLIPVVLLTGLAVAATTLTALAKSPVERLPRQAVIDKLKANGVNITRLVSPAPWSGPPTVSLGVGPNGAPANNANDENLLLVAQLPDVERLDVYKGNFTATGLDALAAMPKLHQLQLYAPNVSPKDLAPLARLKTLESLRIGDYGLTDEVLGYIGALRGLTTLEVGAFMNPGVVQVTSAGVARFLDSVDSLESFLLLGNFIDDACMERIGRMKNMKRLWTDSKKITSKGWSHLAGLTKMEDLYVRGTSFDDEAMRAVADMKELRNLMLDDTRITDTGMTSLAGLAKLSDLGLMNTKITDEGIAHLAAMGDLHNLYVAGTKVTPKGLAVLPRKERMSMMRIGQQPLKPSEFRELREMFERSEIFDPAGFWNPERARAAMKDGEK